MPEPSNEVALSVVMIVPESLPYDAELLNSCIESVAAQDIPGVELIIVDGRGESVPCFVPTPSQIPIRRITGDFSNRAMMSNRALREAGGPWILMLHTDLSPMSLKKSAARAFLMAAKRREAVGMVYADYERLEPGGPRAEVHVPVFHEGRLRDTTDFGPAILYSTEMLKQVGGFDEQLIYADRYDMRLKASEHGRLVSIANRHDGSLATIMSPGPSHNVFDYLLASRAAQLEMEMALTGHLKRIDAYLAPGAHLREVSWPKRESHLLRATVVIPVNHRPEFIASAIRSVQAQTVQDVEAVVAVNGGDSDPSAKEVRRFMPGGDRFEPGKPEVRLLVLDVNNIGLSLNAGLEIARGQYYVQLDSDDRLKPNAVEKILRVFESDPTMGMVIGSYEVWDLDETSGQLRRNESIPVVTHDEWTADNGRNNLLRINGAGAPRSAPVHLIRELGGFGINDSPYSRNYGEDYDLVLRVSERYTIGRVWEPIYEVIRHAGGTDHRIDEQTVARNDDAKDHMRLEAIHRRRQLNAQLRLHQRRALCG